MYDRLLVFTFLFCLQSAFSYAQPCNFTINGTTLNSNTSEPTGYAHVYLKELKTGTYTDSSGAFKFSSICAGEYHLIISHLGCETVELFIKVKRDTAIVVPMNHQQQMLSEVTIVSTSGSKSTQESASLQLKDIEQNSDKNLAAMLEDISGVAAIKNGNNIAKPVVHGLSGNRLTIMNNGVAQNGQQWGADHSPEIDPLSAQKITVIKGAGTVEYLGNTLGSVVLLESNKIEKDPHLHGKARYFFESNGLGNNINLQLQKYNKVLAWRLIGTVKKIGDTHAPDYFLTNTGADEANLALQLEKSFSEKWKANIYLSTFNARLGVLRGSHIGNITDLEEALTRDEPFFTKDYFSYSIEAPYQKVNHHLLKLHTEYILDKKQWIELTYAGQLDYRKEYDVRRNGRSETPAFNLKQLSNFVEGKYHLQLSQYWQLKTGLQYNLTDNTNDPETGILPLIPDYVSNETGAFGLLRKVKTRYELEIGMRYDYEDQKVATISTTLPREIIRYHNQFQNFNLAGGINYHIHPAITLNYNLGYAARNPEVNELYSNGLHQGVSVIEEGDPNLKPEKAFNNTFSVKAVAKQRLLLQALVYFQRFTNYIYLNPQDEIRLTIRGAFPVYKYEQTGADIFGFDLISSFDFSENWNVTGQYAYIRGYDRSNDLSIINLPSNKLSAELNYQMAKAGKFENLQFQINNAYVFEQKNILPSQDFSPPPPGYNLVGLKISAEHPIGKNRLSLFLRADNLLNVSYRDYLNRLRYFADDLGSNYTLGLSLSF